MSADSLNFSHLKSNDIAVLGVPFDEYSSFLKGPAKAPAKIRELLVSGSANKSTELGVDLTNHPDIQDVGDLLSEDHNQTFDKVRKAISDIASVGAKPLVFGGDHSITFPILQGLAQHHQHIHILHFDAHPDLYNEFKGNPLSHACPFARIMENGLANSLTQVGIRTLNAHQLEQVKKFSVTVHEMRHWQGPEQLDIKGPLYVSIDIDALDPAYAPGVSHLEPGGMTVRQILDALHHINIPIIGADIVEYNPTRDINNMTAMVAIKLYKELCGKMLKG